MPRKKLSPDDADQPRRRIDPREARQILASLSPEERKLLGYLWLLRYLRTAQIHELCFDGRSEQWVRQRLDGLRLRGVVNRVKVQDGRRSWAYWYLDEVGLMGAQEQEGIPEDQHIRIRDYTSSAMYAVHYADAADVYIRIHRDRANFEWVSMRERYTYKYHDNCGETIHEYLMADGSARIPIGYHANGRWIEAGFWTYFIELDTGSMTHRQMEAKFDRYVRFYADHYGQYGQFGQWRGDVADLEHWLLVVVRSKDRAENLQRLIDDRMLPGEAILLDQVSNTLSSLPGWWKKWVARRKEEA
jgi:hypothetical protein